MPSAPAAPARSSNNAAAARPERLKRAFQFVITLLACIQLAGGPYALAQIYAWAGMLVTYSQADGLAKGAMDTFSGEKPCELCVKISNAKSEESKRPVSNDKEINSLAKYRSECPTQEIFRLKKPVGIELFLLPARPMDERVASLRAAPPLPPPRWS